MGDDTKQEYRSADTHTTFRIPNPTHGRIKDHQRDSETLAATMDRALDALEREQQLPDVITNELRND